MNAVAVILVAVLGATLAPMGLGGPTVSEPPAVRMIYAIPADGEFQATYAAAIRDAVHDNQRWYSEQLDGRTFAIAGPAPQVCRLENGASYYEGADGWGRVMRELQHCAPVEHYSDRYVWIIYPDVAFQCEASGLGRGAAGVTILHRADLHGLVSPEPYAPCEWPPRQPHDGWIGGLAHELGHAFGLPHPPGCEEELDSCDRDALMWYGYGDYPHTYLTRSDVDALRASPFFVRGKGLDQRQRCPGRASLAAHVSPTCWLGTLRL